MKRSTFRHFTSAALFALLVCSGLSVAQSDNTNQDGSGATSETSGTGKTRIRLGKPVGTFQHGSYVLLSEVVVEAKNVGSSEAQGVAIFVTTPGGKEIQLQGPSNLPPRTEFKYTATLSEIVMTDRTLKARAICSNCYK